MEDIRLEATGLYLDPSELTAPAGSMREALNVRIKRQNLIEPRPGFPLTAVSGASGGGRAVFTWDGQVYAAFGTELWHCDGSPTEVLAGSTSLAISSDAAFFAPMGRCGYVTTDNGVYRIATPGSSTAVLAGIVAPSIPIAALAAGSGLPANSSVAFRVVFADSVNDQLLLGPPSPPVSLATGGAASGVLMQVFLPPSITAGMRVQVYRTEAVASPGETGDEMFLARDEVVTSADVAAQFIMITVMDLPSEVLGASLYTNETQEGILQAAYPPPEAKCLAWWKNMAFYGDTQERGYVLTGTTSTVGADAIGGYTATLAGVTATAGSPIITGLAPGHGIQAGVYVSEGTIVSIAGARIPANALVISAAATTITINANTTGVGAAAVNLNVFGVLDVNGFDLINAVVADGVKQFTTREELMQLVAAYGGIVDVTLEVSDLEAAVFTMTWRGDAAFGIGYTGATGVTLVGLYGLTPSPGVVADPIPSRVAWSKTLQPEAVPLLQYQDIGDWRAPVMRLIPTRDSLFVLKSDGVWRITGDDPDSLRVEDFDRTLRLIHRRAADVFDNQVWAWTSNGVVAISEAGAQRMSEPAIGSALEASQENIITLGLSAPPGGCFIAGCTNQECVLVGVPSSTATGANATAEYIYCWEGKTGAWVRWQALTNIDWRGGVEHKGDMLLVGEDGSLMYQNDDRTDAEAAVTVSLAETTQATIGALGSAGVGHRVTQGSVVAWLTEALGSAAYTTTATLADGAATTAFPMTCTVEWNASPTPGTMSHWRQLRAQMTTLAQAWRVLFGFTSERVHTLAQVWQDFSSPQTEQGVTALRMFIPRAQARCARLRPRLTIVSAGQQWLLNGITLTFEPMRDGNRLP